MKNRFRNLIQYIRNLEMKLFGYYSMLMTSLDELLVLLGPHISRSNTTIRFPFWAERKGFIALTRMFYFNILRHFCLSLTLFNSKVHFPRKYNTNYSWPLNRNAKTWLESGPGGRQRYHTHKISVFKPIRLSLATGTSIAGADQAGRLQCPMSVHQISAL